MLTAIVVGVATTGIALALLIMIYRRYGTLEEDEVIEEFKKVIQEQFPAMIVVTPLDHVFYSLYCELVE
ncbi:MAG: hypothetical protein KIIPBIDF_02119 [Candidatus Methanoperedenaceae archaeon GB50]|nr:MAG: hypothetical protein KIIPBIDF_02119 [Candidatus Methanoperedenaceae archaeon GB50]